MDRFWVIDYLKKVLFLKKKAIIIIILLTYFWNTFCQKRNFGYPTFFFKSLITHKRFIY